jgi:hypothetical protein
MTRQGGVNQSPSVPTHKASAVNGDALVAVSLRALHFRCTIATNRNSFT